MKQNITLSLDKELIRKLRVVAAQRSTSISRMLREELQQIVERSDHYESAKRKALASLDEGLHLGGQPLGREELHER